MGAVTKRFKLFVYSSVWTPTLPLITAWTVMTLALLWHSSTSPGMEWPRPGSNQIKSPAFHSINNFQSNITKRKSTIKTCKISFVCGVKNRSVKQHLHFISKLCGLIVEAAFIQFQLLLVIIGCRKSDGQKCYIQWRLIIQ